LSPPSLPSECVVAAGKTMGRDSLREIGSQLLGSGRGSALGFGVRPRLSGAPAMQSLCEELRGARNAKALPGGKVAGRSPGPRRG